MPRTARIDAPGVLHHVIIRGIERRKIFRDDWDREDLLQRLSNLLPATQTSCYAWVLIPNHAHFLFRTGSVSLADLMRRILTGYAVSFNRRHKRHGQLFQNRYKSIVCQEDTYLQELVRYIHLNPLRAKIVPDLNVLKNYPYSGHSVLMGKEKRAWQDCGYVLGYFGNTVRKARKAYVSYMEAGVGQGKRAELTGGGLIRSLGGWEEIKKMRLKGEDRIKGDERMLGDGTFVQEVLAEAEERFERRYVLKSKGYDLERIALRVGEIFGVDARYVLSKGGERRRVQARSLLCFWAVRELGMSVTELARKFEQRPSTVTYACRRGEQMAIKQSYQLVSNKY